MNFSSLKGQRDILSEKNYLRIGNFKEMFHKLNCVCEIMFQAKSNSRPLILFMVYSVSCL